MSRTDASASLTYNLEFSVPTRRKISNDSNSQFGATDAEKTLPDFALMSRATTATNITDNPGESNFIRWFVVATYFPLIVACLGPLSNMMSIVALVVTWRLDGDGNYIGDFPWLIAVNAISLFFGCLANVALLMNFSRKLSYKVGQTVSILSWLLSSMLLLSLVIAAPFVYFNDGKYHRSEGYWYAVLTVVMYWFCFVFSLTNVVGCLLGRYPANFNLDDAQRGLMVQTFTLAIWLAIGGAIFKRLLHVSYGDSIYYCVVSLLTIGLGDIVPKSVGAKVFALIYSLIGLLVLGLIIAMIRQLILSSGAPIMFWNTLELKRRKLYHKLDKSGKVLTTEQSFQMMRTLRKDSRKHQRNMSLLLTLFIFCCFWLIGALVFRFSEGWSYFNSVYFCFLCLLTIGYGDYAPTSAAGRPFFVIWALGAVPLMTILISNAGDHLYSLAEELDDIISKLLGWFPNAPLKNLHNMSTFFTFGEKEVELIDSDRDDSDIESTRSIDAILSESEHPPAPQESQQPETAESAKKSRLKHTLEIISSLRKLITDSTESETKRYTYEEWLDLIHLIDPTGQSKEQDVKNFWISEKSPLKYPLRESNYLLYRLFEALEERVNVLLKREVEELEAIKSNDLSFNFA